MRTVRIIGMTLGLYGAIVLGLWGFPFTYSAIRVGQSAREAAWSWSGFIALLVGMLIQLVAETGVLKRRNRMK